MKSKNLILGYFHKCGDDEEHFGWIKSFLSDNAEFDSEVVLETKESMVVAFATHQSDEWFEQQWRDFVPNIPTSLRPAYFDYVSDLSQVDFWRGNIPFRFDEISKKLLDR